MGCCICKEPRDDHKLHLCCDCNYTATDPDGCGTTRPGWCCGQCGPDGCCAGWQQLTRTNTYSFFSYFPEDGCSLARVSVIIMRLIFFLCVFWWGFEEQWFETGDEDTNVAYHYHYYTWIRIIIPLTAVWIMHFFNWMDLVRRPQSAWVHMGLLWATTVGLIVNANGLYHTIDLQIKIGIFFIWAGIRGYIGYTMLHLIMNPSIQQACGRDIGRVGSSAGESISITKVTPSEPSISVSSSSSSNYGTINQKGAIDPITSNNSNNKNRQLFGTAVKYI